MKPPRTLCFKTPPMRGLDVQEWQTFLLSQSAVIDVDGVFGLITRAKTREFQIRAKVPTTEKVDAATITAAMRFGFRGGTTSLSGIDVSRWNGPGSVPWGEADFAFVRLTSGLNVDSRAADHLAHGSTTGTILCGYHWLDCANRSYGGPQAALFLQTADRLSPDVKLALAVDIEPVDPRHPAPPERVRTALQDFLAVVNERRVCIVYINLWEAQRLALADHADIVENAPLWLADWSQPIIVPPPWHALTILQTGARGGIDRDVFKGTADDFRKAFGIE